MSPTKPLGRKAYTSIQHLPGSQVHVGDSMLNPGQARILMSKCRPGDTIYVQEKLDGTNVAVARIGNEIVPLIRAGYRTEDSRYLQHKLFGEWVYDRLALFGELLQPGERLCGEWLAQAHTVRYDLADRLPFVVFDLMREDRRATVRELESRLYEARRSKSIAMVPIIHFGLPIAPHEAIQMLGDHGEYGAIDKPEGVVYRCERDGEVDFLGKFVRPEYVPGKYLGGDPVWNWVPPNSWLALKPRAKEPQP